MTWIQNRVVDIPEAEGAIPALELAYTVRLCGEGCGGGRIGGCCCDQSLRKGDKDVDSVARMEGYG